ncbi:MAG: DinB family protein [Anaerolineales bacterium]
MKYFVFANRKHFSGWTDESGPRDGVGGKYIKKVMIWKKIEERGKMEFHVLYHELKNSTETIRTLLSGISLDDARLKPNAESWSILEVVCHLHDVEREDFREHLDCILHRQNEKWHEIDPQSWITTRNYNEQSFTEMLEKFFVEREASLDWLSGLQNVDWEKSYTTEYHTFTAGEMFACWVAHDNLHIRQLVELRRLRLENITKPYNIDYAGDW